MRVQRLADLELPLRQFDPSQASQPNNEQLLFGILNAANGVLTGTNVTTVAIDTATAFPMGRSKSILIIPSGTVTFTSGTPTAQLIAARTPKGLFTGASSQVTAANYPDGNLLGPKVNLLSVAGTTLPNLGIWITPQEIPQLAFDTGHVGLEILFPAAPSQGALAVVLYPSPN